MFAMAFVLAILFLLMNRKNEFVYLNIHVRVKNLSMHSIMTIISTVQLNLCDRGILNKVNSKQDQY